VECFIEISWTENQVLFAGHANVGSLRAAKWEKLLRLVEEARLGIKTRAVRNYIKDQIDSELQYEEEEKRRKFFNGF